ncbi:MAG: TIGR02221 family CRISPR-associated protein [Deltaproteobacteria bacterium]|nr:MAG: TIGR02221 family CRISPR-associated protein [Deltaproteobacteria bacterium]
MPPCCSMNVMVAEPVPTMRLALSFLGTGNYQATTYVLGDRRCTTRYFCSAMAELFQPDRLCVVMTEEARDKHADALGRVCSFEPLLVPSGRNETEIWDLFERLVEAVPENTSLILDVTHGFRSQPLLALTASLFLTAARNVHIEGIYYGAWEARNTATNEAPIFDLTPLSNLIGWSAATRLFVRAGDARPLGALLRQTHTASYKQPSSPYRSKYLSKAGFRLEELTQALALVQPLESVQSARHLSEVLHQLDEDLQHLPQTRPFRLLLDQIQTRLTPLGGDSQALFTREGFRLQSAMIRYYLRANQLQQALTLSREALVSWVTARQNDTSDPQIIVDREYRKPAEEHLNERVLQTENHELTEDDPDYGLAILWGQLRDLRNNINHAGMQIERFRAIRERKHGKPLEKLHQNVRDVCEHVAGLLEDQSAPPSQAT